MEIEHLKEFLYLAETLSFKKTADHFYVSRSVVSRHIASIEDALGSKLVDRDTHVVRLTEVGEVFLREARIIVRDYDKAMERVRAIQDSSSRIVRIGYLKNAARPIVVRFVKYMNGKYPDVHLSLSCMEYAELRRAVDDHTVDVAIAVNVDPSISKNYRSTPLYSDRFYAVMSKDNPLAGHGSVSLDEIPNEKLLLPDSFVFYGISDLMEDILDRKTQLKAREFYGDIDMLYLKVQTEGYIALSSSLNNAIFSDNLAVVELRDVDPTFLVSAFSTDELDEDLWGRCCEGFEWCRREIDRERERDCGSVGIALM